METNKHRSFMEQTHDTFHMNWPMGDEWRVSERGRQWVTDDDNDWLVDWIWHKLQQWNQQVFICRYINT